MSGELSKKTVAFIGCGNMGSAIIRGAVQRGVLSGAGVRCFDKLEANVAALAADCKVVPCRSIAEACRGAQVAVLAVKPQDMKPVLSDVREAFAGEDSKAICISVAAGVTVGALSAGLGEGFSVVRVMPNVAALVGSGIAGIYSSSPQAADCAQELFQAVGEGVVLSDERLLDSVTGVSGSGPGFIFVAMNALEEGGVKMGLPREVARKLAAHTVLGAGRLAVSTGRPPAELRDMVASPGGTTVAGLKILEEREFAAALAAAVEAATKRSRELG